MGLGRWLLLQAQRLRAPGAQSALAAAAAEARDLREAAARAERQEASGGPANLESVGGER